VRFHFQAGTHWASKEEGGFLGAAAAEGLRSSGNLRVKKKKWEKNWTAMVFERFENHCKHSSRCSKNMIRNQPGYR